MHRRDFRKVCKIRLLNIPCLKRPFSILTGSASVFTGEDHWINGSPHFDHADSRNEFYCFKKPFCRSYHSPSFFHINREDYSHVCCRYRSSFRQSNKPCGP